MRRKERNLRRESKEEWLSMAEACSKDVQMLRDGKTVYIVSDWKFVTYKAENDEKKTVTLRTGYEINNRTIDKYGQLLFSNDVEANAWWTNLGLNDYDVIGLYHTYEEYEQFHSEIKADMNLEWLLSGKIDTNELVLELAIIAYNILRMIGQESIGRRERKRSIR